MRERIDLKPDEVQAAKDAARLQGCDCDPDVEAEKEGGVMHLYISHDLDCPLGGLER